MAKLTPDAVRYECGVKINEKLIPDSARATKYVASYVKAGQPMKPCKPLTNGGIGVTIHNTNDLKNVEDDAEQYTRATWPNCNMNGVVVHYYVDDLGAWQNLREDERGWHAADGNGKGNAATIAIEIIMDGETGEANEKAEDNGARLAASILYRHGWTIENLYKHSTWYSKKTCPAYIIPHWDKFVAKVKSYMEELANPVTTKKTIYRVQVGAYSKKANADAMLKKLKEAGFNGFVTKVEVD